MKKGLRSGLALLIALLGLVALPHPAGAHPLGNFTINHYTALTVQSERVSVHYILDMAEIPTFQELGDIRADRSTALTAAERTAYLDRKAREVLAGLSLTLDGKPLTLQPGERGLSFPPGAGGLPTMRLVFDFSAPLAAASGTLQYHDGTYAERPGWREIIATAGSGAQLKDASVPTTDRSQALTVYPQDLISSPPQVSDATLSYVPGANAPAAAGVPAPANADGLTGWIAQRTDAMTELMARKDLPLDVLLAGLVIAFFLGAAHAMSPGHGKTVAAAYLVGSRGTAKHAAILGLTVTITHTIGVFLFGLIVLFAAQYIVPEQLYPWLGFISGMMIVVVGLVLFVQRSRPLWGAWRRGATDLAHARVHALGLPHPRATSDTLSLAVAGGPDTRLPAPIHIGEPFAHSPGTEHASSHDGDHAHHHDHDHDHNHGDVAPHEHEYGADAEAVQYHGDGTHSHGPFGKPHSHLPPDGQPVTMGSLLALGISGGIIPCPSALVVLLSAIAFHRVGLGLVLIIAFSAGLAVVLTVIGLLMVYGRRLLSRVPFESRLLQPLGMLSALAVAGIGLVIALTSLGGNVLRF